MHGFSGTFTAGESSRAAVHTWVRAQAVQHIHHALLLVPLAQDGQLLAREVEHGALAAALHRALPAARLRNARSMDALTTACMRSSHKHVLCAEETSLNCPRPGQPRVPPRLRRLMDSLSGAQAGKQRQSRQHQSA